MKLLWWKHKKEAERLRTKLQRKIEARSQSVRDLDFMLRPLKGSEIVSGRSLLLLCGEWIRRDKRLLLSGEGTERGMDKLRALGWELTELGDWWDLEGEGGG